MHPLRYLNGRTPSPVPAEARQAQVLVSETWTRFSEPHGAIADRAAVPPIQFSSHPLPREQDLTFDATTRTPDQSFKTFVHSRKSFPTVRMTAHFQSIVATNIPENIRIRLVHSVSSSNIHRRNRLGRSEARYSGLIKCLMPSSSRAIAFAELIDLSRLTPRGLLIEHHGLKWCPPVSAKWS